LISDFYLNVLIKVNKSSAMSELFSLAISVINVTYFYPSIRWL